ncbi:MAG TPA: hypothetical protein VI895_05815 [Bdellovibrionota bacterium]|nr:hypothetical protein [Bdellovibrionota bacterium]
MESRHTIFALIAFLALGACSKSETTAGSTSPNGKLSSAFTSDQYLQALRAVSLKANLALPASADVDALIAASDPASEYNTLVDGYVHSEGLRTALIDYYRTIFGMGNDPANPQYDDPARLAAYIIMNDNDYTEILTANYKIDAVGTKIAGQDPNGTPVTALAGFATLSGWLQFWKGNNFLFNYIREIARVSECYEYPDKDGLGAWTESQIAPKYRARDDINCHACHSAMNVRRSVFYHYSSAEIPQWRTNPAKSPDLYGHEKDLFNGSPVDEPLNGGQFKFVSDITTPADFGLQITQGDRFKRCTARRFLAFGLGYASGSAGQGLGKTPFDFDASSQEGDRELLEKWTGELVNTHAMKIRPFLTAFFQSEDFIQRVTYGGTL